MEQTVIDHFVERMVKLTENSTKYNERHSGLIAQRYHI